MAYLKRNVNLTRRFTGIRRFNTLKVSDILKFISSLLLPLALGVFTSIITIQQQNTSKLQREQDQKTAELQRNQERVLTAEKYANELFDSYIKDMAALLEKYNGSLTNDKTIATITRVKTLNVFRRLNIQYNTRIIRFLYEAGQLNWTEKNIALDLSTAELHDIDFRDLAVNRKTLDYLSLYHVFIVNATFVSLEMKLNNFASIHLHNANFSMVHLTNIEFSSAVLENINFSLSTFANVTFVNGQLMCLNFSKSYFNDVIFSAARFENVNFSLAQFKNSNFDIAQFNNLDFLLSEMSDVSFYQAHIDNSSFVKAKVINSNFSYARMYDSNFTSGSFVNTDFSQASFFKASFEISTLKHTDFSSSQLLDVSFLSTVHFQNMIFSNALLNNISFSRVVFIDVDFSHSRMANVKIAGIRLQDIIFSSAKLAYVDFSYNRLNNTNFSLAIIVSTDFSSVEALETYFIQTTFISVSFKNAKLFRSKFWYSNLKYTSFVNATLSNVSFMGANLYKTDFTGAIMTDSQLQNALSIQDALLPNGSVAKGMNIIKNGYADCNTSIEENWKLEFGNVTLKVSDIKENDCRFHLQSPALGAILSQRITLSDKWNSISWPYSQVELTAHKSTNVLVYLRGINSSNHILAEQILSATDETISILLENNMEEVEVLIMFDAVKNQTKIVDSWCDDIELFIVYGTYLEHTRVIPHLPTNIEWDQCGVTIAGDQSTTNQTNQLLLPFSVVVDDDDDQTVFIVDQFNHRIIQLKRSDTQEQIVAGGNGAGDELNQLFNPTDVLIDKRTNSLIVCDWENQRVMRWSRSKSTKKGEIFIDNDRCFGLATDEYRYLYISDDKKHEVRRYHMDQRNKTGIIVAGGNGKGIGLNQLSFPSYVFVDQQQNVYVSDNENHRVMKWNKNAKEGIIVAGGNGDGEALTQLSYPNGLFVDEFGTLYVAESGHSHRVTRWFQGADRGVIIAGGHGEGSQAEQLRSPVGLSFDKYGNLYVVDCYNNRVQRFSRK